MIIDMHGHLGNINFHPRWQADAGRLEQLRKEAGFDFLAVSSAKSIMYDVREGNREVMQAVKTNPHLLGYVVVSPLFPDSLSDLHFIAENDRMIGAKLHPDYQGLDARAGKYRECIDRVADQTDLVLFHTSCMPGTGFAVVESLLEIAVKYSRVRFILAHMAGIFQNGNYPYFPNLSGIEKVADSGLFNVWVDTAHHLMYVYPGVMEEALSILPADRFIFGTDVPLQGSAQMKYAADIIGALPNSCRDKDKMLFENALHLFGAKADGICKGAA